MKFRSIAWPSESPGLSFVGIPEQVVPDQSMSLHEILERFTRGESVTVGKDVEYGSEDESELNVDLEKLRDADLVDREEFSQLVRGYQSRYDKEQKARDIAETEKLLAERKEKEEKRIRIRAKKLAAENAAKKA